MKPRIGIPVLAALGLLTCITGCAVPDPVVESIESPAGPGSGEPNLARGRNGELYLSWIEPGEAGGHVLRFSVWQGEGWSTPRTIASGNDWFVNWADFPSMAAAEDGTLLAHWLAKSGQGTYAYDVRVALSTDGGESWGEPITPHTDGTQTEHGFVSIVPADAGSFDVIWLDGREMQVDAADSGHGVGSMTLRSARIDREGRVSRDRRIDERVCDCCQTDAIRGKDGTLVVAYRDRSDEEIRDISTALQLDGDWSSPGTVHPDGWVIPACPVNGPAMASAGERVAAAWFTGGGEQKGRVHVAFSDDGGRTFGAPIRADQGEPLGRVDLVLIDDRTAVVSWIEQGAIRIRRIGPDGPLGGSRIVAETSESRASGFPRMALHDGQLLLAWTEAGDPSRVRTARTPA